MALREGEFTAAFEALARDAGIPLRQRGGNLSYLDVALRDAATKEGGRRP